jgi:uncharacterized protein (TIGR02145 family)
MAETGAIDIKANASDGPVTIAPGDILSVSVQLDSGDLEGENADWWVLAELPPGGWYHYKSGRWKPDISYTKLGPVQDVAAKEVLNISTLPEGTYTFYFGVDTIMNGKIDMGALHYDTVEVNITTIPDTCGAFVAPDVWKEFDCYNLAAIGKTTGDDPFTPSWRLIGGYWHWGRKGPDSSQWYDNNTENFAHGPTGSGDTEANEGEISNWDDVYAPDGSWSDSEKTVNDPCPAGYRVPTIAQWEGVLDLDNNTQSTVGTWSNSATNYSSARFFGDDLMLPAAGYRDYLSGALITRGTNGFYWSSSELTSSVSARYLNFTSDNAGTSSYFRVDGFSVRCIAE